ncbi:hypothetical protein RISW2_08780 [Roseivivax isoporae LMG 25204]|uniref:DUF4168 domain-containing protein n=2 Tax=Roseivivax TaxID=93682 RepID=X7F6A3_9RHOB|nr:hypothetical protein RISW2_08780 [Roseivivax isoporae LMG 25204]
MKRIMLASALALSVAGTAYAATEAEMVEIQSYLPNADVSTWTDEQVATAMNVINSDESRSDKMGQLQALYDGETYTRPMPELTEAERTMLMEAAPEANLDMIPQARLDAALVALNSEMSESDRQGRVQELLSTDTAAVSEMNSATAAEVAIINDYAPDVDVSTLSDEQVTSALAIIYSTDSRADAEGRIQTLLAN